MNYLNNLSLRVRLTLLFIILTMLAWGCASFFAWHHTTKQLNRLFDTQQILFAKRLVVMSINEKSVKSPNLQPNKKLKHAHMDDDALTFAVFTTDGRMVINDGENGPDIPYSYTQDGFFNGPMYNDEDEWRYLWITSPDGKYHIVVGQEWEYREEMALKIITRQLIPWLVALPLMILLMTMQLSRELSPLKKLTQTLRYRSPDVDEPLSTKGVPGEVRPLVEALNQLFTRSLEMMTRERRFTSDAAHELRSPLTALKVQTEVAQLSMDEPEALEKALSQLHIGIDRAARLVEQLLTLSRLDSLSQLDNIEQISMADLLESSVMDIYHVAQQAGIEVRLHIADRSTTKSGQPLLLGLLVRNLLDNAVRYSPRGSVVDVNLDARGFTVRDNGRGVSAEELVRIGERFYRPPGQDEPGSGLGLSIVRRIASLHAMDVTFENAPEGGFVAKISW
ncbi:quorum sensing histidine kinase QseC [uncultured Pluralibacter sp.]|uniref:quorum sensing histidine kinase QseC n=1 Tax=uncultured Pluralibacter sp. TaxID=1490864 RepID=UPI0026303EC7|nr:quorum sensing histidine kinase QseC [uncultured Pluralibacter sp.]